MRGQRMQLRGSSLLDTHPVHTTYQAFAYTRARVCMRLTNSCSASKHARMRARAQALGHARTHAQSERVSMCCSPASLGEKAEEKRGLKPPCLKSQGAFAGLHRLRRRRRRRRRRGRCRRCCRRRRRRRARLHFLSRFLPRARETPEKGVSIIQDLSQKDSCEAGRKNTDHKRGGKTRPDQGYKKKEKRKNLVRKFWKFYCRHKDEVSPKLLSK